MQKTVCQFPTTLNRPFPCGSAVIPALGIYSGEMKTGSHTNPHANAYSSFISNCPKQEATQLTFNWGADKHYTGQPHRGTLLSHKKDPDTGNHTDDSQRPYAE